jgi:hypothetical protein
MVKMDAAENHTETVQLMKGDLEFSVFFNSFQRTFDKFSRTC